MGTQGFSKDSPNEPPGSLMLYGAEPQHQNQSLLSMSKAQTLNVDVRPCNPGLLPKLALRVQSTKSQGIKGFCIRNHTSGFG